ncbi:hypothetical protein ASD23_03885 [Agromyces sp. Root1464]|uniref:ROK family transcriptional regulator n=1 Tax=Agromyces sp. Root1464 TaxID=1736467 RepID=UPI00071440CB|nr:ROK family transcriptional regulator [Agromyces sp. Root1464]KQZ11235.1 hypothetical protein ASD23_03885 [Agromyces sp. Root1464]
MTVVRTGGTSIVKRVNTGRVLADLRRRDAPARIIEIAEATGLARPTVAQIVDELVTTGWLHVHDSLETVGRPAVRVSLNVRRVASLGLDVGPHRIVAQVRDGFGQLLGGTELRHDVRDGHLLLDLALKVTAQAIEFAGIASNDLAAACVASIGVVDRTSGRIHVVREIDGWEQIDIGAELGAALGCAVRVDNDANLAARAMLSLEETPASFMTIQWGERVGAGLVLDRRLFRGGNSAAGEIGSLPVRDPWAAEWASLEQVIGSKRIGEVARLFAARDPDGSFAAGVDDADPTEYVFRKAAEGNRTAELIIDEVADVAIGAIAPIALALDLNCIYVTGGIARGGAVLAGALERRLHGKTLVPIVVRISPFAEDTVVRGACSIAVDDAWDRILTEELGAVELQSAAGA